MTTPTGTIDLGALTPGPQPEPDAPWPVLVRLRRWHSPRRTGRLAGLAAVTVLVLLTATAAAAPPRPLFTPQLTLPAVGNIEYDQQNLYVVEAPATGRTRVVAYRLTDWTVQWERPLASSGFTGLFGWEGVLLAQSHGGISSETVALAPRTGRKLWGWSGDQGEPLAGGRFLVTDLEWEDLTNPERPPPHQLTALDPATGRPLWTVPVPDGGSHATEFDLDSRYLVTYGGAGNELVSYDLTTGDRLAGAAVPALDRPEVQVRVVGSLVLLRDRSRSPSDLLAYDARTLSRLWTIPAGHGFLVPSACGDLLCVVGERQPPRAFDPTSGEQVWSADWLPVTGDEFIWVSDLASAELDGLLLAQSGSDYWLIDARTGESVLDLRGWQLSPPRQWASGTASPLLFKLGADRTVVGRLAPDLSGIRPLGTITVTQPWQCGAGAGFVFCATEPDNSELSSELTGWRHRLP